jgi:hypothetical protein
LVKFDFLSFDRRPIMDTIPTSLSAFFTRLVQPAAISAEQIGACAIQHRHRGSLTLSDLREPIGIQDLFQPWKSCLTFGDWIWNPSHRHCERKTFMAVVTAISPSIAMDEFFSSRPFTPESFVRLSNEI